MSNWPKQNADSMNRFYGPIGSNHTTIIVPEKYPMVLYGGPQPYRKMSLHKKIADPVQRVLSRTLAHYGTDGIRGSGMDRFFGCYNPRRMRGGSAWSIHAWAAALDFDANRNQLRWGRDRANFAKPFYDKWWQFWEDEGATSLGRARNFDWMHVQFADL